MVRIVCAAAFILLSGTAYAQMNEGELNKAEKIIEAVSRSQNIAFIRNGKEHTSQEAAAHLRLKLSKSKKRVNSAEEFVEKIASKSLITGKPYLIKYEPSGKTIEAKTFMMDILKNIKDK